MGRQGAGRRPGAPARLSRRRLLAAGALAGAGLAAGSGLTGCAGGDPDGPPGARGASPGGPLVFANWPMYLDVDPKVSDGHPTLRDFERSTGVSVVYKEEIVDNEAYYAALAPRLRAGEDVGRDLVVLSDWMAARMVREGLVQRLDDAALPAARANLVPWLRTPDWDPARAHAVPWQAGITGIAYDSSRARAVGSVEELFRRTDLKGRVTVLSDWRDTLGLLLLQAGHDPADFTDEEFASAVAVLGAAVDSGQVRAVTGNGYTAALADGTACAAVAWSGDVQQLRADNEAIRFVVPEAGAMVWSDELLVPVGAGGRVAAQRLVDFYYDPQVAARLSAQVQFVSPVAGARQAMARVDPPLADEPLIFPDAALLARCSRFATLDAARERRCAAAFAAVTGG